MKRETAKKLIENFNDEELFDLGFYAGRHLINHYAKGGDVRFKGGIRESPTFRDECFCYELVKPTYKLFGIEIEGEPPLSEEPEQDQRYWYLTPETERGYLYDAWYGASSDEKLLKCGLIFATEEGAKTAAKALGWCDEEE